MTDDFHFMFQKLNKNQNVSVLGNMVLLFLFYIKELLSLDK